MKETETLKLKADNIPFATDGLSQPTIFADYIRGAMASAGVVKLNLVENRVDALIGEVRTVHVMTLITPILQLRAWAKFLSDLADQQNVPALSETLDTDG